MTHSFLHTLPGGGNTANIPGAAVIQTWAGAKQVIQSSQTEISGRKHHQASPTPAGSPQLPPGQAGSLARPEAFHAGAHVLVFFTVFGFKIMVNISLSLDCTNAKYLLFCFDFSIKMFHLEFGPFGIYFCMGYKIFFTCRVSGTSTSVEQPIHFYWTEIQYLLNSHKIRG